MEEMLKQPGAISWSELMTTDVGAAKDFYAKLFGWTTEDMAMEGEGMPYAVVKAGTREIGGMMPIPPEAQGTPPMWGSYVTVDDVDATARQAKELGARLIVEPRDIPNVGRCYIL